MCPVPGRPGGPVPCCAASPRGLSLTPDRSASVASGPSQRSRVAGSGRDGGGSDRHRPRGERAAAVAAPEAEVTAPEAPPPKRASPKPPSRRSPTTRARWPERGRRARRSRRPCRFADAIDATHRGVRRRRTSSPAGREDRQRRGAARHRLQVRGRHPLDRALDPQRRRPARDRLARRGARGARSPEGGQGRPADPVQEARAVRARLGHDRGDQGEGRVSSRARSSRWSRAV